MESPTTIVGLLLMFGGLIVLFLRGVVTRHFEEFDKQKLENAALRKDIQDIRDKSARRDDELADMRREQSDTLARLDRQTKAREQAEVAQRKAETERDTVKLEKAQLDNQYKQQQRDMKAEYDRAFDKLNGRIVTLEDGRKADEQRASQKDAEHRKELAERDSREAALVKERDAAVVDRDTALQRVALLETEVQDLKRQVDELSTELRQMKEAANNSPEKASGDD